MKILLLCERLTGHGGWYTYTRSLKEGLQKRGHSVTACVCNDAASDGVAILPLPLSLLTSPWKAFFVAHQVHTLLEEVQPDIIHITVEPYALLVPFLPKKWQDKTVLSIHGSYGIRPLEMLRTRFLAKRYYACIAHFITVSSYTKVAVEFALRKRGWKACVEHLASHTSVIHNSIPLPSWQPHQAPAKKEKSILLVGGVKPRKGVLEAIDACAIYKDTYGDAFHFTIVGDCSSHDTYVKRVMDRIIQRGLQKHVSVLGPVSEEKLASLYVSSHLYLMPALTGVNTFEGFGIVYIEANAYGVPCIGPNDGGATEAIVEGKTGYHINPREPEKIAERMHRILEKESIDPKECRRWAEEHGIDEKAKEMEDVYEKLL